MDKAKSEEVIVLEEEKKTLDGLLLKKLPKHLKYVFLGENDTKPIIISTNLNEEMNVKLSRVLKKNVDAFYVVH